MNRNQWFVLSASSILLAIIFQNVSLGVDAFDPFIWLFYILGVVVFPIMLWLESKKK